MQVKSFLVTLGLGMVGGAVAATMLTKEPKVCQAVAKAADSVKETVCGNP